MRRTARVSACARPATARPATGLLVVGLLAAGLLTACTTTVDGTGRPGAAARPSTSGSSTTGGGNGGGSGEAPLDVWDGVRSKVVELPAVTVTGTFAGAGFGPGANGEATIKASYGESDGNPLANVTVTTNGQTLTVLAVGGSAWVKAATAFYTDFGYDAAQAAQANGKWVRSTDDDKGLDALASLAGLLQICGPDNSTDDLTATAKTEGGQDVVVLASEFDDGSVTVDPEAGQVLTSQYSGDDLTFAYPDEPLAVTAPPAAQVVTIPDF